MNRVDAIIIGAGPAGLAAAQQLGVAGFRPMVLEKDQSVGSVWRRHYDRLRLHSTRAHSSLPDFPMPATYGRYPSRAQFVSYLEDYAARFGVQPVFGTAATSVRRDGDLWRVIAGGQTITTPIVVVATGWADFPYSPDWPGIGVFEGPVIHSSRYRNASPFAGGRVLVVGFGNSGAEIALDLCEAGAHATIAVRSPVRILPRDLFGVSILNFAIAQRFLPARVADALNAPILRFAVGSIESLGMTTARKGPIRMIKEDGRVPLLDVGTVAKIREGRIEVRGAIERFTPTGVVFRDGREAPYDAVILATGFRPDLRQLLPDSGAALDAQGRPRASDRDSGERGLFFIGAIPAATGQLREIRIGAGRIAAIARRLNG